MKNFSGSPDAEIIRRRKDAKYYNVLKRFTKRLARTEMTLAGLFSSNSSHIAGLLFGNRLECLKQVINCERDRDILESLDALNLLNEENLPYITENCYGDIFRTLQRDQWKSQVDVLDIDLMCTLTDAVVDKIYYTAIHCMVKGKTSVLAVNTVAQRQITTEEAHAQLGKLVGRFLDNDHLTDVARTRYIGNNNMSMLGVGLALKMSKHKTFSTRGARENIAAFIEQFGATTFVAVACIVRYKKIPVRFKTLFTGADHEYVRRGYLGKITQGVFSPYIYMEDGKLVDNMRLKTIRLDEYIER